MLRRLFVLPTLVVLAVGACGDERITSPDGTEVVLSERELAQVADLEAYIGMVRSGVDPASDEARALNERIMERYPVRPEALEAVARPDRASVRADGPVGFTPTHHHEGRPTPPEPVELVVGTGPAGEIVVPEDIGSIAAAIAAAGPGGTVIVRPGFYEEDVVVDGLRDVTILGIGAEQQGDFRLDGDGIVVAGFTWVGHVFGAEIRFGTGHVVLANTAIGGVQGITLLSSQGAFVAGNRVMGADHGILVSGTAGYGFGGAQDNLIAANVVSGAVWAIALEGEYGFSRRAAVLGNILIDNTHGVYLYKTEDATVAYNLGFCNTFLVFDHITSSNTTSVANFESCTQ